MRLLLFDWTDGGHHRRYLRRFASALQNRVELVIAAPEAVCAEMADCRVAFHPISDSRPMVDSERPRGRQHREFAARELGHLSRALSEVGPDLAVHMYGDPVLRWLVSHEQLSTPLILCIFFYRSHYPTAFGDWLGMKEYARAVHQAYLLRRWHTRGDCAGVLLTDPVAVRRLRRRHRRHIHWLPEPPVPTGTSRPDWKERRGCVLFGALAPRKGIERLARAAVNGDLEEEVVLAGAVEPGFEDQLGKLVEGMRQAGVHVDLRDRWHGEDEALELLGQARCVVLPYPRHYGMSRVLLEAASVGTPVVAEDFGLLGHLVRSQGLGRAVDTGDPRSLSRAIAEIESGGADPERERRLTAFAAQYCETRFAAALSAALGLDPRSISGALCVNVEARPLIRPCPGECRSP